MSTSSSASKPSKGWQPPTLEEMQTMLPQYEFVSLLGRGGMGAVYKAVQLSLDRVVAVKVLPGDLIDDTDAQFAERFKNEARTMAKMNHPAIVNLWDFGETQTGLLFIVMEFIDGTDVSKMIGAQGRLPEDYALSITAHVCDALQYAHARGVIHRDIKPANILINMEGAVKVADFGLAKQSDAGLSGLTKTNMAMGTPDFVAPEALSPGTVVDGRADLYAVGVMLFQMLTGEIPRGLWSLPGTKVGTDPRFDGIITKAMQTDREVRYQSAAEIRQDLHMITMTPRALIEQQAASTAAAVEASPTSAVTQGMPLQKQTGQRPSQARAAVAPVRQESGNGLFYAMAAAVVVVLGLVMMFSGREMPKTAAENKPAATPLPAGAVHPPSDEKVKSGAPKQEPKVPLPPPARPQVSPVPGGSWRPVFTEALKKNPSVTELPDGWMRISKTYLNAPNGKDMAIRARMRFTGGTYVWPIRFRDASKNGLMHYGLSITREGKFLLFRRVMVAGKYTSDEKSLMEVQAPRPFAEGTEFDLEVAAQGDRLLVKLDGEPIIDVRDTFHQGVRTQFGGDTATVEFKNLEWRPLSADGGEAGAPAQAAVPAPAAAGVDVATRREALTAALKPGVVDALAALTDLPADETFVWEKSADGVAVKFLTDPGPYKGCLALPVELSSDYVAEAWFTIPQAGEHVGVTIPVGDGRQTTCWIWPGDSGWAGLGKVDGHDPQAPEIEKGCSSRFQLPANELTHMRTEVRRTPGSVEIRFSLNGVQMAHYKGPTSRLITSTAWRLEPKPELLQIGARQATFHRVEIQSVNHEAEEWARIISADPRLTKLDEGFRARYESDAKKPFEAGLDALNRGYVEKGLARARAAAQAGGRSAEVAALDAEKALIENGRDLPAEDSAETPETLQTLRGTYRAAFTKLEAERETTVTKLQEVYVKALDDYVVELTKADRIADAGKVQSLREALAKMNAAELVGSQSF